MKFQIAISALFINHISGTPTWGSGTGPTIPPKTQPSITTDHHNTTPPKPTIPSKTTTTSTTTDSNQPSCFPETLFNYNWLYGGDSSGGVWYLPINSEPKAWNSSLAHCAYIESGSQLATILSEGENTQLKKSIEISADTADVDYWTAGFSFDDHQHSWFWYIETPQAPNGENTAWSESGAAVPMNYLNWMEYPGLTLNYPLSDTANDCMTFSITQPDSTSPTKFQGNTNFYACSKQLKFICEVRC